MNFCPKCENYLYLEEGSEEAIKTTVIGAVMLTQQVLEGSYKKKYFLNRRCRTCGYTEIDTKGGLVNETIVQERASETPARARAPSAISRATSSLTAPCAARVSDATPTIFCLASFA